MNSTESGLALAMLRSHEEEALKWTIAMGNSQRPYKAASRFYEIVDAKSAFPAENLRYLFAFTQLKALVLIGEHITDDHVNTISGIPTLISLEVHSSPSGKALEDLKFPSLQILRFTESPLTDESLLGIELPSLVALDVNHTAVTNRLIEEGKFKNLQSMWVADTNVDAKGLSSLGRFPHLTHLYCDAVDVDEEVVAAITKTSALKELRLVCMPTEASLVAKIRARLPEECKVTLVIKGETELNPE